MTRYAAAITAALLLACAEPVAYEPPAPEPTTETRAALPQAPAEADAGETVEEPAVVPEAPAAPVEAPALDAWIVWARDEEGGARSFWVQRDGEGGFEVTANDGIVIAVDGQLWQWAVYEEELPTSMECEWIDQPAAGGTGARAVLERVDAEGTLELVAPDREAAFAANDWQESVGLEASVGPYLFVHRSAWGYHCGAHGGSSDAFVVIDARTGEPAALEAAPTDAMRQRAWAQLEPAEVFTAEPGELAQTLFRPVFEADGMSIEHQLTADTCYACGDGLWDSYTASARVRGGEVPAELAPLADVPPAALELVRERYEPAEIGGVSRADATLLPAFEQLFVPGC